MNSTIQNCQTGAISTSERRPFLFGDSMPWHIGKNDSCPTGKPHAVIKDADGSVSGCHATEEQAKAQLAALNIAEEKAMDGGQQEKGHGEEMAYYTMATSFAEMDKERDAHEQAEDVQESAEQFKMLVSNIMLDETIEDKGAAVQALAVEFSERTSMAMQKQLDSELPDREKGLWRKARDYIQSLLGEADVKEPEPHPGFMTWKEADGIMRWVARYSNNFRDDDSPPEIISAASHRRFVERVDNKEADLPELWLWHRPEWRLGRATWVAYDDSGFALAGGVVDDKGIPILDALTSLPPRDVRVSHGMPSASIERNNGDDPTIITSHITREISPLPTRWAANKGTGFAILKENEMSIPTEKRQALIDQWGLSDEQLVALEQANVVTAEAAKEAGIESKEKEVIADAKPETTEKKEQETEQAAAPETAVDPLTRAEVAEAFMAVLQPLVQSVTEMQAQLAEVSKELGALKETDAAKIADKAALTPAASLLDLMQIRAVGNAGAQIDGRSSLAKSKPQETDPTAGQGAIPGVPVWLSNIAEGKPIIQ